MNSPHEHWPKIRNNNVIERFARESAVVQGRLDHSQKNSALMLVYARIRYMEDSLWGSKIY